MWKLRLLFVADGILDSLRRIIELLNEQMKDTEALGVEIKPFLSGQHHRILVPKLLGQTTAAAQVKKQAGFWDEGSYMERVGRISGAKVADICRQLLAEFTRMGFWIYSPGKGKQALSRFIKARPSISWQRFTPVKKAQRSRSISSISRGHSNRKKTEGSIQRFIEITGIKITEDRIFKRPSFPCEILKNKACFDQYIDIYRDILAQIQDYESNMD